MPLPWTLNDVPHAVLDILRGCNIRCPDCFNTRPARIKPLQEVEAELDGLMKLRKLHSVSIVGGEITLHPELVQIVRMVKSRGLYVELFSNGVDLTPGLLQQLKAVGASVVFCHIEKGQKRPDLPVEATDADLHRLRTEKMAMIAEQSMDAGLALTLYPDHLEELENAVTFMLQSPDASYMLVTLWRESGSMSHLSGDIAAGLHSGASPSEARRDVLTNREMEKFMLEHYGFEPFGYVGSNLDAADPRWLSYLVASTHSASSTIHRNIRPTFFEKLFLKLRRTLSGRYPFYQPQNQFQHAMHMALNGLAGGGLDNLKFLHQWMVNGGKLSNKRILFQCPAEIDSQGNVIFCVSCPDAVIQNGALVPLCLSDYTIHSQNPTSS